MRRPRVHEPGRPAAAAPGEKERERDSGATRRPRQLRLGAVLLLVAAAAITLAATASAGGQLFRELIDEEEVVVEEDFCGIEGLTVEFATHRVGVEHAVRHGPDGLVYFGFNLKVTEVVTNLANGNSVTSFATVRDKDQRVTDNATARSPSSSSPPATQSSTGKTAR